MRQKDVLTSLRTQKALIALGSNIATQGLSPPEILLRAAARLQELVGGGAVQSPLYRTPAFPAGTGPDYANGALALTCPADVSPRGLLDLLHQIEQEFGRQRDRRWAGRSLDLDLLAVEDVILPDSAIVSHWVNLPTTQQAVLAPDQMILPHPRLQDRAFVLVPLADVAPHWRHPLFGLTVAQMLAALPEADRQAVIPLQNP
jgi:2-amino-4-hydroxy-6-hydroxymethyldihydropteridine diphosphokinase